MGKNRIDVQVSYGKSKNVKIDGKEVSVKSDGDLEGYVIDQLNSQENVVNCGLITSLKDPHLPAVLKDWENILKLKETTKEAVPTVEIMEGKSWKVTSWQKGQSTYGLFGGALGGVFGGLFGGIFKNKQYSYEEVQLSSPALNKDSFPQLSLQIGKAYRENTVDNYVTLEANTDTDMQRLSARFNPETGEILDNSITEWVIHKVNPPSAQK